jgi:hypothetical protein
MQNLTNAQANCISSKNQSLVNKRFGDYVVQSVRPALNNDNVTYTVEVVFKHDKNLEDSVESIYVFSKAFEYKVIQDDCLKTVQ